MSEDELRNELIRFIKSNFGTRLKAAESWDVCVSYVSAVTTGRKPMPEWMLNKIGYERKIVRIEK